MIRKPVPPQWWKAFYGQRRVRWSGRFFVVLVVISVLANLISSDLPFYCRYQGVQLSPWLSPDQMVEDPQAGGGALQLPARLMDWHKAPVTAAWWAPIPYSERPLDGHRALSPLGKQVLKTGEVLPWRFRHWLGTDSSGRDLLALLLRGGRISLGIAFLSMLLAGSIGFLIGSAAGYFGDDRLRVPIFVPWVAPLGLFLGYWYGFGRRHYLLEDLQGGAWWGQWLLGWLVLLLVVAGVMALGYVGWRLRSKRMIRLRLDFVLSRIIEVLDSLPQLLLIIALGAVFSRSIWTLVLLIGFTSWSGVARLVRPEALRVQQADYILAARISGLSQRRILLRHVWPQVLPHLLVPLAFGLAGVMVVESGLSFLNVIERSESWGGILSTAIHSRTLWWIPLFPGLAIFLTVLTINVMGESLRKALSPGRQSFDPPSSTLTGADPNSKAPSAEGEAGKLPS